MNPQPEQNCSTKNFRPLPPSVCVNRTPARSCTSTNRNGAAAAGAALAAIAGPRAGPQPAIPSAGAPTPNSRTSSRRDSPLKYDSLPIPAVLSVPARNYRPGLRNPPPQLESAQADFVNLNRGFNPASPTAVPDQSAPLEHFTCGRAPRPAPVAPALPPRGRGRAPARPGTPSAPGRETPRAARPSLAGNAVPRCRERSAPAGRRGPA